jgi:hypothetical protein
LALSNNNLGPKSRKDGRKTGLNSRKMVILQEPEP